MTSSRILGAKQPPPPHLIASAHGWAGDHVAVVGIKGCESDTTCGVAQPSAWNYVPSEDRWAELDMALPPVDVENNWSVEDPVVRGGVAYFPVQSSRRAPRAEERTCDSDPSAR